MTFDIDANLFEFPIIQLDHEQRIAQINRYALKLFKWTKKSVLNQRFLTLIKSHKGFSSQHGLFSQLIKNKKITQIETISSQTIYNWKYSSQFLIGTEITDLSLMTHKEKRTQAYLDNIIDNIPCYIYWKDKNSVYQGCNKGFAIAAGFKSPQDIIGKTDFDFAWGKTEAKLFRQGDREVLKGISKLNFEEPQFQASGKHATVLASKVPMHDKNNNIIGILGVYIDITERKKVELALEEEKIKAEKANRIKSEFVAVVSHELRTPLNGILGLVEILLMKPDGFDLDQIDSLKNIQYSGKVLLNHVNDILDFAKLEAGKLKFSYASFDVKQTTADVINNLSVLANKKKLSINLKIHRNLQNHWISDEQRYQQILINLVSNAIRFSNKGKITISLNQQNQHLKLSVKDTGIGIPKEKINFIFEKFNQLQPAYESENHGIGLGLSITKYLVEQLQGSISVKSKVGVGSEFTVTLPLLSINKSEKSITSAYQTKRSRNKASYAI